MGDYQRATDLLRQAAEALPGEALRERVGIVTLPSLTSRCFLLLSLADVGEFTEGEARGEEGVRTAEAAEHLPILITVYWGLGRLFLRKGELDEAVSVLERGLSLCEMGQISTYFILIAASLGYTYALSGRVAEAVPLLERVLEEAQRSEFMYEHALYVTWLSEAYLLADCQDEALALAQRTLAHAREHKERGHQAYTLWLLGEIATRCEPPDVTQAEAHYRQ